MTTAFEPLHLGRRRLDNRIAMSPMTRSRACGRGAPNDRLAARPCRVPADEPSQPGHRVRVVGDLDARSVLPG